SSIARFLWASSWRGFVCELLEQCPYFPSMFQIELCSGYLGTDFYRKGIFGYHLERVLILAVVTYSEDKVVSVLMEDIQRCPPFIYLHAPNLHHFVAVEQL